MKVSSNVVKLLVAAGALAVVADRPAERLLVLLRDGRKLLGILRSYDQFGAC